MSLLADFPLFWLNLVKVVSIFFFVVTERSNPGYCPITRDITSLSGGHVVLIIDTRHPWIS